MLRYLRYDPSPKLYPRWSRVSNFDPPSRGG
jgi:hypothetical protein